MKKTALLRVVLPTWSPPNQKILSVLTALLLTLLFARPVMAADLKIMKTGLGSGTVTSLPAGINCGGDCIETFAPGVTVTLTAIPDAVSTFVRWEGDIFSTSPTISFVISANIFLRPVFRLTATIPVLTDFTPAGIQAYLTANPTVNTPAKFVKALPAEYRQNWILMTRSESLQTGTAEFPRLLLPSSNAQNVFTIGLVTHGSYPGSHPNAIEFMQWDPADKNFRFHEIVLDNIPAMGVVPARIRTFSTDDSKCSKCHSTNNILNRSGFPGTTGIPAGLVKFKNKPNWDAYDSWGGMMPFNRDRIYQGSVEAAAFRKIFNLWTWSTNPGVRSIIEQLDLQPASVPAAHVITRLNGGANDGQIKFVFDGATTVLTEPVPSSSGTGVEVPISTNYSFDRLPGTGATTSVTRGGAFITLHHSAIPSSDEGRGVRFFDALGGLVPGSLNQQRIADELINHRFATGSLPIDIRPIALAITKFGLLRVNSATNTVESLLAGSPLTVDLSFFNNRNGFAINDLVTDTRTRTVSVTRRKADIQKINLDRSSDVYLTTSSATPAPANGLIQQYGAATSLGVVTSMSRLRQEVFRRPNDLGNPDATVMGGIYVDRELYSINTEKIALFRYFLEPLGVSVDKWSMGVRGRSRTYSFADVFGSYLNVFESQLKLSLISNPVPGLSDPNNNAQLIAAVNSTLSSLPAASAIPKYTDVQRIFNKSCIECHGGLNYPPYSNFGTSLDLSENESPTGTAKRLDRANSIALAYTTTDPVTSQLYQRITRTSEDCPFGLMPCGGPALTKTDIETIRRWIVGGRPYTNGDPHIRTIDGINYDFQAAGEFVLLRGENLELQARHTAVATNTPVGPNGHTGLTSCVSVNSAFAIRVGKHRVSYQPNIDGKPDPSGLQLWVDGELRQLTAQGISLASDGRIIQTTAPGGIQVEASGGTMIIITPAWWDHYKIWYMNIDTRNVRATEGLMGSIAPGNWLPALPDGRLMGARPNDLNQRYKDLYTTFGNAWRVNDTTTLFKYASGTSTRSFTVADWPHGESPKNCELSTDPGRIQPQKPLTKDAAVKLCSDIVNEDRKANCIVDVMATGEPGFAKTYLLADKIDRNAKPNTPVLRFPKDFDTSLVSTVTFSCDSLMDKDNDPIAYKLYVWPVNEIPDNNKAILVSYEEGGWQKGYTWTLIVGLLGIILFVVLFLKGLRKKPVHLVLLAIAIIGAVIGTYFLTHDKDTYFSKTLTDLEPGKAYFWKVIVEDDKGGTVESEIRRLQIK